MKNLLTGSVLAICSLLFLAATASAQINVSVSVEKNYLMAGNKRLFEVCI